LYASSIVTMVIVATTSSTTGNTTLIVAYLNEARLHTFHIIQLQSVVSRVSDSETISIIPTQSKNLYSYLFNYSNRTYTIQDSQGVWIMELLLLITT